MNSSLARSSQKGGAHQRAQGQLDIALGLAGERTRLVRFYQDGCLKARYLQPEGTPELVSMNISGGIAGGDALSTKFELGPGADAVFTTQAAERIYKTLGDASRLRTRLRIGPDAQLAYLPQETILFDGFNLDRTLEVDLMGKAKFIGVESLVFGRTAMGETVGFGALRDRINIRRNGRLIWRDVAAIEGDISACLGRPGIGVQARAMVSLFVVGINLGSFLPRLRDVFGCNVAGISAHEDIVLIRALAAEAAMLRRAVMSALAILRNGALPRVWQS